MLQFKRDDEIGLISADHQIGGTVQCALPLLVPRQILSDEVYSITILYVIIVLKSIHQIIT